MLVIASTSISSSLSHRRCPCPFDTDTDSESDAGSMAGNDIQSSFITVDQCHLRPRVTQLMPRDDDGTDTDTDIGIDMDMDMDIGAVAVAATSVRRCGPPHDEGGKDWSLSPSFISTASCASPPSLHLALYFSVLIIIML